MKRWLIGLLLLIPVIANSTEPIVFPNEGVLIVEGASNQSHQAPLNSGFPVLAGGSATDGCEALTQKGVQVYCAAKGGSFPHSIYAPDGTLIWKGYKDQLTEGYSQSEWPYDSQGNRAKAVFFGNVNGCFTPECNPDAYITSLNEAVNDAITKGLRVIVAKPLPFEYLDLQRALSIYGVTEFITAENYAIFVNKHNAAFADRRDVIYIDAYDTPYTTIDGLHADYKAQKGFAQNIWKAVKDIL